MTTRIDCQISFEGPTPLVSGNRYLTLTNLAQLLNALNHGSRQRTPGVVPTVKVTPSIVRSTATVTVAAPTTGQTVTIAGTALTAQQSRARATATPVSAVAGDLLTVGGFAFVGTAGAVTLGALTFSIDTSDAATAVSIAAQINAYVPLQQSVSAFVSATGVVTIAAVAEGTSGNGITLTSTGGTITVTGSGFLAGGAAIANNKFDFGSGNNLVAISLTRAINASTTAAVQQVIATVASAVVTLTAHFGGVAGNAITLTSASNTTLAVTGSGFLTGGTQGATTVFSL